ncbi:MAG: UDP-galactopyranose mutase, partial [Spirosomaceae bacterium]|nr:UDP-galactopyranose mutase [Spirosomataceae bacterium]
VDFFKERDELSTLASKIVFTGNIDEYYGFKYGKLEYRSLQFENEILDTDNYQGNAVVNYTEAEVPYTRIIEHKHFEFGNQKKTVITKEYPVEWQVGMEAYYPMNDEKNNKLFKKYKDLSLKETNTIFGGRLAEYKYYDMHQVIGAALAKCKKLFTEETC